MTSWADARAPGNLRSRDLGKSLNTEDTGGLLGFVKVSVTSGSGFMVRILQIRSERLDRVQRLIQVIENVVDILDPHGDAHQAVGDADRFAPFHAESCMSHRRRVGD